MDGLKAFAESLRTQFQTMTEKGPELAMQARKLRQSASSGDGLVTVTVDSKGALVELKLDPRIYRQPDSTELAATIMSTIKLAASAVQEKVIKTMSAVIPEDQLRLQMNNEPDEYIDDVNARMNQIGR